MTVEAGRKLGRYVLSRKIGAGGMAEVWEAFDEGLHRSVAVKVVRDEIAGEVEFRERFIREARLAAQLEHPRILPIYDFGTEGGVTYLVMPLLPGGSLKERISGPMPADEAVEALAAIAAALDHAHGRGVLHRDVKPSNVLVDASGSLLLADFGLAKNTAVSSELTVAGMVVGTPAYMAPEQAVGRPVDSRADQYALGIVAFELLTGRTPFRSESPFAILDKHLREAPPPPSSFVPDLPLEVDAVVARALAKEPQERFGTCRQMVEALAAALGASMPMRPSTAVRAARPADATWIAGAADTAATLPPTTPRPTRATPRPAHLTMPAPQTAVTARRPAPAGPSSNAVVAAIVVVALLFIGVAAGVGWTLFRPKGTPAEPAPGEATLPTPAPVGPVPSPTPETAGTGEAPSADALAGAASTPTDDSSRVTIEELGVPTMPPATPSTGIPRATLVPVPSAATGSYSAAPTSAPRPVPAPPTAEPQRPAEPASSANPAARLERVVPFRTKESVPVGIEDRFITIESVEVTGWPKPDEVRKAESKPGDTTSLALKFTYSNRDDDDWKCIYRVQVLDDQGKEIGLGVQDRTLNGTEAGDTNRVSVKMKTLDFPRAAKIRVKILARPD
jgi:serine/threonine-protein kinase